MLGSISDKLERDLSYVVASCLHKRRCSTDDI